MIISFFQRSKLICRISLCACAHGVKSEISLDTGVCVKQSSRTLCAPLLIFEKTFAQPHFADVNCSDAVMSVYYSHAQPDIFAVMNCRVVALSVFSSDILTSSADSYLRGVHVDEYAYYFNELRQNVSLQT